MAIHSLQHQKLTAITFLLLLAIIELSGRVVAQQQCRGLDIGSLITECAPYVRKQGPKTAPSKSCCGVIKKIDLPCACKYVNPDVERMVSVEKAVYVAQTCGLKLKHGFKCGSYTVPN